MAEGGQITLNEVPGLVMVIGSDCRIEYMNRHALAYFGDGFPDLRRLLETCVHPEDLEPMLSAWALSGVFMHLSSHSARA